MRSSCSAIPGAITSRIRLRPSACQERPLNPLGLGAVARDGLVDEKGRLDGSVLVPQGPHRVDQARGELLDPNLARRPTPGDKEPRCKRGPLPRLRLAVGFGGRPRSARHGIFPMCAHMASRPRLEAATVICVGVDSARRQLLAPRRAQLLPEELEERAEAIQVQRPHARVPHVGNGSFRRRKWAACETGSEGNASHRPVHERRIAVPLSPVPRGPLVPPLGAGNAKVWRGGLGLGRTRGELTDGNSAKMIRRSPCPCASISAAWERTHNCSARPFARSAPEC